MAASKTAKKDTVTRRLSRAMSRNSSFTSSCEDGAATAVRHIEQ